MLPLVLVLASVLAPAAAVAAPNDTLISSRFTFGEGAPDGTDVSDRPAVSRDGRFVAFVSQSANLVGDPTPNPSSGSGGFDVPDVYVRDHLLNETRAVSIGSTQGANRNGVDSPSISANGRYVVFGSRSNELADDPELPCIPNPTSTPPKVCPPDSTDDLYRRDLQDNTVTLVTRTYSTATEPRGGGAGCACSGRISGDGRYVVFASSAPNLVLGDSTAGSSDVFVRDLKGTADKSDDTTTRVAEGRDGWISGDGRYVAFTSNPPADDAATTAIDESRGGTEVFVTDRDPDADLKFDEVDVNNATTSTTTLVSRASDGGAANGRSGYRPDPRGSNQVLYDSVSMSADGRFVAFNSDATNLVADASDLNGKRDVYVRDLKGTVDAADDRTTLVSRAFDDPAAAAGVHDENVPSISGDGRFVSFDSDSPNADSPRLLVAGDDNNVKDVFVRDLQAQTTALASAPSGKTTTDGSGRSQNSSMSADGRFVAFDSQSNNLVANDNNATTDVFRRELAGPPPPVGDGGSGAAPSGGGDSGGGGAILTVPGGGGLPTTTPAPTGAGDSAALAAALARERIRARAFRSCLARAARHTRLDLAATRTGSLRARALARRHLRRHRASMRRRCVARHGRTPGRVTGLGASAAVRREVVLSFRAPGTDGSRLPPARGYLVKQSTSPITDLRSFRRAQTLCNGSCRLPVTRVGEQVKLRITDLRPKRNYYYAVAARDNVTRRLGPRSQTVRVRTR